MPGSENSMHRETRFWSAKPIEFLLPGMSWYWRILLLLFALHLLCMSFYLHRVPGLLGDEGSEGENVYQILDTKQLTVYGERSYIGPLIDYVRVPFILALGYTVLPLRLVTLIFSLIAFWLAAAVFKRIFGEAASLYILAAIFFSPIYLLYQRLGWAITLIPFFALLIIWLLQRESQWKYLWAGLAAGIGLHNHFIFFPTFIAIVLSLVIFYIFSSFRSRVLSLSWSLPPLRPQSPSLSAPRGGHVPIAPPALLLFIKGCFIFLIGFAAGFSTQLAVLLTQSDDQGNPTNVVGLFTERVVQLPEALPAFLSGSVFSAFYTGEVFAPLLVITIILTLGALIALALFLSPKKLPVALWLVGTIIQLVVLVLIVDRFAARYFMMIALSIWGVAGYGLFITLEKLHLRRTVLKILPLVMAIFLTGMLTAPSFFQFLAHGGSTHEIKISSVRRESAAAFVDIRPFMACLVGQGIVHTENVHIYNRLLYVSHNIPSLALTEVATAASVSVTYRLSDQQIAVPASDKEVCPSLAHFRVHLLE